MSSAAPTVAAAPAAPSLAPEAGQPPSHLAGRPTERMDAIFDAQDGPAEEVPQIAETAIEDPTAQTDETQPQEATEPEKPAEKAADEATAKADAELEAKLNPRLREGLKEITDAKVRRALRGDHMIANALRESGMRVGEIRERMEIAPTVDLARTHRALAETALSLGNAWSSNTPDGVGYVVQKLSESSPEAFTTFIQTTLDNLPHQNPMLAREYSARILMAADRRARELAAKDDDPDMAAAADIYRRIFGIGDPAEEAAARPQQDDPAAKELAEYKKRESETRQSEWNRFMDGAYRQAGQTAAGELKAWIAKAGTALPPKAQERLFREIAPEIHARVSRDVVFQGHVNQLTQLGLSPQELHQKIVASTINFIRGIEGPIRAGKLREFNEMFLAQTNARTERKVQAATNREVTGGGSVVTKPIQPQQAKAGKGRDAFDDIFERNGL